MTLEEKLERLGKYCDSTECLKCKLRVGGWANMCGARNCPDFDDSPEEDLDRALAIIGAADYWANVCEIQERQTKKGISKYGQRLEDNESLSPIERLEYLEEELIDGLMYIEHIKAVLRVHELGVSVPVEDLKKTRDFLDGVIRKAEEVVK